jgi:acetyl esterase
VAELDPGARLVIDFVKNAGGPPLCALSPAEARTASNATRATLQPPPPDVTEVRDFEATGRNGVIPMRLYRNAPLGSNLAGLVFFHGGGFVVGDLDSHDVLCRQLAIMMQCVVIAVHYRRAPEHKFPAGVEDAIDATRWVARHAVDLSIDADRLAVGGDSAGGNLAAVVAIDARNAEGPAIKLQILAYPMTDHRGEHASRREFSEGYLLNKSAMDYYDSLYLRSEADRVDWRASPLIAKDLSNLPPALILTAGFDPLVDEGENYGSRLAQAGNTVILKRFPSQIHGFLTRGKFIPQAMEAVNDIAKVARCWL